MSQIPQQVINPVAVDPNNIPETYANGPINLNIMGPCGTLTFTTVRGDIGELMAGKQATTHHAIVTSRVTTPIENLVQLRDLLNRLIQEQPMAPGSSRTQ